MYYVHVKERMGWKPAMAQWNSVISKAYDVKRMLSVPRSCGALLVGSAMVLQPLLLGCNRLVLVDLLFLRGQTSPLFRRLLTNSRNIRPCNRLLRLLLCEELAIETGYGGEHETDLCMQENAYLLGE